MKAIKRQAASYYVVSSRGLRNTTRVQVRYKSQTTTVNAEDTKLAQTQEDFPLESTGWLEKNPEALALVKLGVAQVKEGKVKRMSFAEYADLEIDD